MKYFLYALTLAFIVLKLTNYIGWSWAAVLSPLILLVAWVVLALILLAKQEVIKGNSIDTSSKGISRFQQRMEEYQKANGKA